MNADDKLLTVSEVAKKLSIKEDTVRKYLRNKQIKGLKLGRNWRIREKDLEMFINEKLK